jgi:hypothetical protein
LIGFILTKAVNPSQLASQDVALSLSKRFFDRRPLIAAVDPAKTVGSCGRFSKRFDLAHKPP